MFRRVVQGIIDKARNDPAFLLLNVGTATGLAGFSMTDPLPLRTCSVVSSVASIIFVVTRKPIASMAPVYWSCCFISVNMIKILELLREQQAIELTDIEEDVFVRHFLKAGMRPRQFKALFKQAKLVQFDDGAVLHKEGEVQPPSVRLLLKGAVDITLNGERVFTVDAEKPICFLGDTHVLEECDRGAGNSYLPAFSATATAVAPLGEKVVALEWTNVSILWHVLAIYAHSNFQRYAHKIGLHPPHIVN